MATLSYAYIRTEWRAAFISLTAIMFALSILAHAFLEWINKKSAKDGRTE